MYTGPELSHHPGMKTYALLSAIAVSLLLFGCNKGESASKPTEAADKGAAADKAAADTAPAPAPEPPADPVDDKPAADEGDKHEDHGAQPKEVQAFHDVFSPIWNIEDKAERQKKFCAGAEKILEAADVFAEMKPAEGVDAKAWSKATNDLGAYIADADRVCSEKPEPFNKFLTGAHDAFHAIMELTAKK
jgi:hypothetical protein